jgi:hypothetical protein
MELRVLDPRAAIGVPITPYDLRIGADLSALRVGLLCNGFFDAGNLLTAVGNVICRLLPGAEVRMFARADASTPARPEMIEETTAWSDAVVTAMGHCGSCTSSTTRDAVNVARAGTPVVALITAEFWGAGGFVARSVGMPDVPRVQLPHPVAGTGLARIAEIAEAAAPRIIAAWSGEHVG